MRFESITAHDFGPFHEQSLLDLAPGMNVIYGPNEAGKSSWHAALYAGLCGIRRARGIRSEDKDFAERHKPWDNPNWRSERLSPYPTDAASNCATTSQEKSTAAHAMPTSQDVSTHQRS